MNARQGNHSPGHVDTWEDKIRQENGCGPRKRKKRWSSPEDLQERFWKKVNRLSPDECWPWATKTTSRGYGAFNVGGKLIKSHRIAYRMCRGEIPAGMLVCHRCDNPLCCNPSHLFLGSGKDNIQDMIAKGRQVCLSGEDHGSSILSEEQVVKIRNDYASGSTQTEIAERHGVSRGAIGDVVARRRWRGVSGGAPYVNRSRKLTPRDVMEIRGLRKIGWSGKEIGPFYGITDGMVYHISSGRAWRTT